MSYIVLNKYLSHWIRYLKYNNNFGQHFSFLHVFIHVCMDMDILLYVFEKLIGGRIEWKQSSFLELCGLGGWIFLMGLINHKQGKYVSFLICYCYRGEVDHLRSTWKDKGPNSLCCLTSRALGVYLEPKFLHEMAFINCRKQFCRCNSKPLWKMMAKASYLGNIAHKL